WSPFSSYNLSDYITKFEETAVIMPCGFCEKHSLVTIFVISSINEFRKRQRIRNSWGNSSNFNYPEFFKMHGHLKGFYYPPLKDRIRLYAEYLSGTDDTLRASVRVVFIIGRSDKKHGNTRKLRKESDLYNDIIQEEFVDNLKNRILKSVLALKQFNKKCFNTSAYFFKADHDSFVNIPNLIHVLLGGTLPAYKPHHKKQLRLSATSGVLLGHKLSQIKPIRDMCNKNFVPQYIYPETLFPRYLSGSGYLMSRDVARQLYDAAWHTEIMPLEDVFITGLCSLKAQVNPVNCSLFSLLSVQGLCDLKENIVQNLKDHKIEGIWNNATNNLITC
ncbi:hypothetical protein KR074_001609, partial [Drosophila pseudoananassae]